MQLSRDLFEFVVLLNKNGVQYLIIGGYAVSMHGYPRFTGDFDVWINRTTDNAEKIVSTIEEFGLKNYFKPDDFLSPETLVQIGNPPLRIDILNQIDGIEFNEAFEKRMIVNIENENLNVINLEELIKNKKASGRLKDLADAEELEKLKKKKK